MIDGDLLTEFKRESLKRKENPQQIVEEWIIQYLHPQEDIPQVSKPKKPKLDLPRKADTLEDAHNMVDMDRFSKKSMTTNHGKQY